MADQPQTQPEELRYNRRYVGYKETLAYLFNDVSNAFNIGGFNNRFIWDIVKIDFNISAAVGVFTGAWDIINDSIIAVLVDRTRTRWGKFRPYILGMQIPLTLFGMLYWFMPLFFAGTGGTHIPKLVFYFIFNVINETAGTFTGIAKGGYMSTITPNPTERSRLILLAELLSGNMGEDLPNIAMGVFIDLINNNVVSWKLSTLFLVMGIGTAVISSAMSFYFVLISRERVQQRVDRPSILEGFKALFNNRPVLMIMLAEFLGNFRISIGQSDYFIDVLGSTTLRELVNLPSGFVGTASYAFVPYLRKRFSSKAMWVFEDIYTRITWIAVFLIGLPNKNYEKRLLMAITFGVQAFFEKWMFGVRKVINADLFNESMDYCEWKNGYRVEATTSVAKGLVTKIQGIALGIVYNLVMGKIGYVQGRKIGTQDDRTKRWMFTLCTGFPAFTSVLGVIPKFFYPISKEMRIQMYNELYERRSAEAQAIEGAAQS